MVDWYYRKYLFGLIRVMHLGYERPWWLGFCYYRHDLIDSPCVVAPIPLNWIIGFIRIAWLHIVIARPLAKWQIWLYRKFEHHPHKEDV